MERGHDGNHILTVCLLWLGPVVGHVRPHCRAARAIGPQLLERALRRGGKVDPLDQVFGQGLLSSGQDVVQML